MIRRKQLAGALAVLGIVLLVAPALFPIQPALYHDTRQSVGGNETRIAQTGYDIVAYENLSERGQDLYVETLRNGGEYSVPVGAGAPDFTYPTDADLREARGYIERNALEGIVIERPQNSDLPPADERAGPRYDAMETRTGLPPITAFSSLLRLLSALVGIIAIGSGGYLRAKP